MANESVKFNLPPGRIISGSPTFRQDKDPQGKPKDHPNWFLAVAVPKTDPGILDVINLVINTARAGYSANQLMQQRIGLGLKGGFRWKIDDGDDPDDAKNRGKEGWAGSWIFKFSKPVSGGPLNCCDQNGQQIDPSLIKCGHWVDISASTSVNGNTDHTAGVYMNPIWIRFLWFGQEIASGPSAEQAFQAAPLPRNMPAGASATPLSPGGTPGGTFGGGPAPAGFGGGQPAQIGFGGQPAQGGFGGGQPPQGQPANNGFGGGQPQPGFAGQPQPQPGQPQPGFNPNTPQPVQGGPTAEQVAQHYRVQHHVGWRWNPATNSYDEEPASPPAANGPGAQAGGFGGPAHSGAQAGFQGTVSPSNPYPGATPHNAFVSGGQR